MQAHHNIVQLFADYKGVARVLLKDLPASQEIYTGRLRSVPKPLFVKQRVALIGDASSACSPMLQQGAASAFEDVLVLSMLLSHFSIEQAFTLYQVLREPRVNWIVKTSDDAIRAFVRVNSWLAVMKRNLLFKHKGPLNVLSWKTLLAMCPLDEVERVIESVKKEALK
jgi:2-polyprenyl-6-methoxyphenol hydroxylase-like FAD-dependent oxidoreductase